jgi:hypothetical protein
MVARMGAMVEQALDERGTAPAHGQSGEGTVPVDHRPGDLCSGGMGWGDVSQLRTLDSRWPGGEVFVRYANSRGRERRPPEARSNSWLAVDWSSNASVPPVCVGRTRGPVSCSAYAYSPTPPNDGHRSGRKSISSGLNAVVEYIIQTPHPSLMSLVSMVSLMETARVEWKALFYGAVIRD